MEKNEVNRSEFPNNSDTINRQQAIDELHGKDPSQIWDTADIEVWLNTLPSAQPTLYGYNIEHLEIIARALQKEDLPPERVAEALINIGEIVAIVRDEFEETLRKAAEECTKNMWSQRSDTSERWSI